MKVGDRVLAYNPKTGKQGYYRIKAVLIHKDKVIEQLEVDGERLTTTPEHPFYTRERGFVPAGDLVKGMHVREANGGYRVVQSLSLERHTERMYNLTVDTAHTFYVGEKQLLVHNTCGASTEVPLLGGLSLPDAESLIGEYGGSLRSITEGGYRQYGFPDGSTIWIRDNGEVM